MADLPDEPDFAAGRAALEVASAFSPRALVNHSRRSYLWSAAYAQAHDVAVDHEVLYVAALLHDLGLAEAFDSHALPFEHAGGNVAWVFGAGAGWPIERREHAARIVIDHMRGDVTPQENPEGWLLMIATSWDISGARADEWPPDLVRAVCARYPRLDLAERFVACFADQAARKPASSAARSYASGIAQRMARNPLEHVTP